MDAPATQPIDAAAAYQALLSRDARFDGRLFVGVTSTGIYCRPICRVRTPSERNCRYFRTPAQAEAAAFRPCMKCRPEVAPGAGLPWTVMDASRTLARQGAEALDLQAASGEAPSLGALAARLGVSDRHLRRIFQAEHGVTPLQYLQTRRLLLAKQLLTDTALPVAEVAAASGYRSLRRFNAAFADNYRMSPSRLRRDTGDVGHLTVDPTAALAVRLGYRAPYDIAAMLRFVQTHAIPEIEAVHGNCLRSSLRAGTVAPIAGWIEAEFASGIAVVHLRYAPALAPWSGRVVAAARRWLDLDAAPQAIAAVLAGLPGEPGLRLPGSLDAFELAVRAVLGQQVTVSVGCRLARRVVERFGATLATPWPDVTRTFPDPAVLAPLEPDRIAELGIIRSRAGAIVALARAWPEIEPLLGVRADPAALIERLCALPGIGPWTAHYIAMRALGWPDAFLPGDVAVLKALRLHAGITTWPQAHLEAERWRPWRSYAVLHLWNSLGAQAAPDLVAPPPVAAPRVAIGRRRTP